MHKRKFSDSNGNDAVYDRPYNLMQFPSRFFFSLLPVLVESAFAVCNRVTDATIVGVTVSCLSFFLSRYFISF